MIYSVSRRHSNFSSWRMFRRFSSRRARQNDWFSWMFRSLARPSGDHYQMGWPFIILKAPLNWLLHKSLNEDQPIGQTVVFESVCDATTHFETRSNDWHSPGISKTILVRSSFDRISCQFCTQHPAPSFLRSHNTINHSNCCFATNYSCFICSVELFQ